MRPTRPTFRSRPRSPHRRRDAFTLIELLVVISIISLIVGLSFPYVRSMIRASSEQMAANAVANAVSSARSFAVRYKPFTQPIPPIGRTSEDDGDGYSGAAIVVTPANELRLVENDETGHWAGSGQPMELPRNDTDPIRNGYRAVPDVSDLLLPGRVAILGIRRTGDDEIELLPPPFAIAFTRRGTMATRTPGSGTLSATQLRRLQGRSDGWVYHAGIGLDGGNVLTIPLPGDNDNDGEVRPGEVIQAPTLVYRNLDRDGFRSAVSGNGSVTLNLGDGQTFTAESYADFTRGGAARIQAGVNAGRRVVPFDILEPVVGVVIFNPDALPAELVIPDDEDPDTNTDPGRYSPDRVRPIVIDTDDDALNLLSWATRRGQGEVMFFNRNTGNNLNR